ncbi:MAG: hypothetical protein FWE24_05410 [Defluviitaleaceae bacterium]|nr:hypothetical protein [Defluviitaleaceae bacterium]
MTTKLMEESVMTDFQFKALMTMVLDIVERSETKEQIRESIEKLASGELNAKKDNN